jgi:hypothetical protein
MPVWLEVLLTTLIGLVMLISAFGLLVPMFPGITIIWLAALGYGIIMRAFTTAGTVIFIVLTVLMLLGVTVDNLLMGAGARKGGASWLSIGVALAAGILGTILFPPFGGLIAAPSAVLLLEYWRVRDFKKAWRSLFGMAAGWGLSFVFRFIIGSAMFFLWLLWVFVT